MATYYRWVPEAYAESAKDAGLISHNGSAMWIFGMGAGQTYRPGVRITRGAILIAFDLDELATTNITTRGHIDFEDESFEGEAAHREMIIVKSNEPGAFGIGRQRQSPTNFHTRTRYAKKREVAKALDLREREVGDAYTPPGGWPR